MPSKKKMIIVTGLIILGAIIYIIEALYGFELMGKW